MPAVFRGLDAGALLITLATGTTGGLAAHALNLPLGYLLGSLLATGTVAATGIRPFGKDMALPPSLRMCFIPVIGVAIGGAFTPEVAAEALGWLPSLAALCLFLPLAHALAYVIFRRGGLDPQTAFFGGVPGGLIESVQMGEEAGADVRLLTVLQFLRLIGIIVAVPLIFWAITGHSVGSSSGVQMVGAEAPLTLREGLVLLGTGVAGVALGRALSLPGWIITGPTLLSSAAHSLALVEGVPPAWLLAVTQVVVGTGLGARFAGVSAVVLRRGAVLAMLNGLAGLILALGFALVLHRLVGEPVAAVFLAFAPGGLAEMSLIALSLDMSVIYVTAHHVARIVLAVGIAKAFAGRVGTAER